MRERVVAALSTLALALLWHGAGVAGESAGAASLPKTANMNLPYPEQIDLVQDAEGWTFRLNENNLPLYMSTADPLGKSACNDDCAKKWVPVRPDSTAKSPVGEWSLVMRDDGSRQWAFKRHPVYTLANSTADKPAAPSGTFHLMPHFH
jgi:predicted lipoprotein with Yx(FWY)xxD motif